MRDKKIAFISGITGQDGSYLAELLLGKGYHVHGLRRKSSSFNAERVEHLYQAPFSRDQRFTMHYGDITDFASLSSLLNEISPDEIYNLAAQSHVAVSFQMPIYTAQVNAIGALNLLEAARLHCNDSVRFYQASTSEMYGGIDNAPQSENTPFCPRSPYAVSKLFSHCMVSNYRETFGMYACSGLLFNHESERRGETFVTRKVTMAINHLLADLRSTLYLGNLDARRDWGHAEDYVEMQWLMLQQEAPKDYVIATGFQTTVRDFVDRCFQALGVSLAWSGSEVEEVAQIRSSKPTLAKIFPRGRTVVRVDSRYFRPLEVENLLGDPSLARAELGWSPKIDIDRLIQRMLTNDISDELKIKYEIDL